jgi:endogenous inhibitor of DNA gyrase (YacG/DUF329 family)
MSILYFNCPTTQKPVSTGIAAPNLNETLDTLGRREKSVVCPHCGEPHDWRPDFAYFMDDDVAQAHAHDESNVDEPIIDAPLK